MAKSRRSYVGAAVPNALGSTPLTVSTTTINLAADMSGWSTSSTPFFIVIDAGTAKEEKICVLYNSARVLTVVDPALTSGWVEAVAGRGIDGTERRTHDAGAVIYPVFTATEADQANELVSKYTTNGDIVVHGESTVKTISTGGISANGKVLVADSTVTNGGVKWAQVTADGIATSAVTSDKILDGTIVNADINASAAVAYSKLSLSNSIVAGDITASAVTNAKLNNGASGDVPLVTVSASAATGGKNGDVWIVV
jgi:hypothetical protein